MRRQKCLLSVTNGMGNMCRHNVCDARKFSHVDVTSRVTSNLKFFLGLVCLLLSLFDRDIKHDPDTTKTRRKHYPKSPTRKLHGKV